MTLLPKSMWSVPFYDATFWAPRNDSPPENAQISSDALLWQSKNGSRNPINSWLNHPSGCFLKWWYPTNLGFPTKNDHFGVFWGYHHLRKHPSEKICSSELDHFPTFRDITRPCQKAVGNPIIIQAFDFFRGIAAIILVSGRLPNMPWKIMQIDLYIYI